MTSESKQSKCIYMYALKLFWGWQMAEQERDLAAMPGNLSFIPGTHVMEEAN